MILIDFVIYVNIVVVIGLVIFGLSYLVSCLGYCGLALYFVRYFDIMN
jgi:hypothetical protein